MEKEVIGYLVSLQYYHEFQASVLQLFEEYSECLEEYDKSVKYANFIQLLKQDIKELNNIKEKES